MTIKDYLTETEYAATQLIKSVWDDYKRAEELQNEIKKEAAVVQLEYNRALAMQLYAEDPDDVMLGVGKYWDNYFGADKDLYHKKESHKDLQGLLASREYSMLTLCGSILEHAKKGLSIAYGKPNYWPLGRLIGTQPISKVILEARNQAIHIDEAISNGKYNKPDVAVCFQTLGKEVDSLFNDFLMRDLSFEVVNKLGWRTFNDYEKDMLSIV